MIRLPSSLLARRLAAFAALSSLAACGGGPSGGGPILVATTAPVATGAATAMPSGMATIAATAMPSGTATAPVATGTATAMPSGMATVAATAMPSGMATVAATAMPSSMATVAATAMPSGMATAPVATGAATAMPSGMATVAATAMPTAAASAVPLNRDGTPLLHHVFLLILENQAEDNTFGSLMPVPYLQKNVSGQGAFVPDYWGTSHASLGNYISLFGGQSVTTLNQDDCPTYSQILNSTTVAYGQVSGSGCVYPASATTIADQLQAAKFTAKGYMEDMGNDTTREANTCGQTQPTATTGVYGTADMTQSAQAGNAVKPTDQYAMRHNPWPYYMSVVSSGLCASEVRPLTDSTLTTDLQSVATTANFTWITPNLCDDGHDVPCSANGANGDTNSTYDNENAFLQKWVPIITRSPAFQQDGLLIINFDESTPAKNAQVGTDTTSDSTSCCQEPMEIDPNTSTPGGSGGADGTGGGKTGAVVVSPFIAPGTVTNVSYNHYSVLHQIEDEFGLPYLGFAGYPGTVPFGSDLFGTTATRHTISL